MPGGAAPRGVRRRRVQDVIDRRPRDTTWPPRGPATRLGPWDLGYDQLGSRFRHIGPYALEYDQLGSRLTKVVPMRISYDHLGTRVSSLLAPGSDRSLPDDDLAAFFFALRFEDDF
ncbi:MAG: hypothetical protein ACT4OS_01850 [Acidimicrobiales bacterium]